MPYYAIFLKLKKEPILMLTAVVVSDLICTATVPLVVTVTIPLPVTIKFVLIAAAEADDTFVVAVS
jgi:hypothetical protein